MTQTTDSVNLAIANIASTNLTNIDLARGSLYVRDKEGALIRLSREERYQQLIDSSIELFARNGFEGATTRALAKHAGVTEPVLYQHFRDKEALYLACLGVITGALRGTYAAIYRQHQHAPLEFLQQTVLAGFNYVREHPDHGRFLLTAFASMHVESVRKIMADFINVNFRAVYRSYNTLREAGKLPPGFDSWAAAWTYVGSFFTLLVVNSEDVAGQVTPEQSAALIRQIVGLRAPGVLLTQEPGYEKDRS